MDCYCVSCELLSASIADALLFVNILVSGIFHGCFAQQLAVNKPCLQIVRHLLWKQTKTHSIRNKNSMFDGNLFLNSYGRLSISWCCTQVIFEIFESTDSFCALNMFWLRFLHGLSRLVQSPTPSAWCPSASASATTFRVSDRLGRSVVRSAAARRILSRCTFLQCGRTNAVMQQARRGSQLISGSFGGSFPHASRSSIFSVNPSSQCQGIYQAKDRTLPPHLHDFHKGLHDHLHRRFWNINDSPPPKKRGYLRKSRLWRTRGRGRPINSILLDEGRAGRRDGGVKPAPCRRTSVQRERVAEFALHVFQFEISHVRTGK